MCTELPRSRFARNASLCLICIITQRYIGLALFQVNNTCENCERESLPRAGGKCSLSRTAAQSTEGLLETENPIPNYQIILSLTASERLKKRRSAPKNYSGAVNKRVFNSSALYIFICCQHSYADCYFRIIRLTAAPSNLRNQYTGSSTGAVQSTG